MIRIEYLTEQHLAAVALLHRQVFRSRISAADLRWKYSSEHTGADHGCFVAMDGEAAVAFHGVLPQVFELAGRTVIVGQSCDNMAARTVWGKGIYRDLSRQAEERMLGNGAALLYGAANRSSERALLRDGWRAVGPALSRFTIQVRTPPLARAIWRVTPLRTLLARWIRRGFAAELSPLDGFVNSLANAELLVQRYSPAVFRFKAPNRGIGVRSGDARAWLKASPDLLVGDLYAPDVASLSLFITLLMKRAKALGVRAIHCYAFPGTAIDTMLGEILPRQTGQQVLVSPNTPVDLGQRLRVGLADLDTF